MSWCCQQIRYTFQMFFFIHSCSVSCAGGIAEVSPCSRTISVFWGWPHIFSRLGQQVQNLRSPEWRSQSNLLPAVRWVQELLPFQYLIILLCRPPPQKRAYFPRGSNKSSLKADSENVDKYFNTEGRDWEKEMVRHARKAWKEWKRKRDIWKHLSLY